MTSDHVPVVMSLSFTIVMKKLRQNLTNKFTDWELFRDKHELVNVNIRLKTIEELEQNAQLFINNIREAAQQATPLLQAQPDKAICQSLEIREMIRERRRLRKVWHNSSHPEDKTAFNRMSNNTRKAIQEVRQKSPEAYLEGLSPEADKNYSL